MSGRKVAMLLSEAFQAYEDDVISFRNMSPRTSEANRTTLKLLVQFFGDIPIETLTFQMVRQWKVDLEKTRSDITVRMYVIKLRVVLAYLRSREIDCLSPDQVPVPKRIDKVPEFITKEDVARLIEAVGKPAMGYNRVNRVRNQAIVAFLYASGCRVSEMTNLNRLDIRDDGTFTIVGKGGYARLCFLDERAIQLITAYLKLRTDREPALFIGTKENARIMPNNVQQIFRLASSKAGFEKAVHPHTMRHSFATNLLISNTNLYHLSRLLGHKQLNTTAQYLHAYDYDLKQIYDKHHTV